MLDRYGTLEGLVSLAVEHDELRTLLRVLHSAGPRGQKALLQLSERMKTIADGKTGKSMLQSEPSGLKGVPVESGDVGYVLAGLSADHLYQLLYRSYMSLGLVDAAGESLDFFSVLDSHSFLQ